MGTVLWDAEDRIKSEGIFRGKTKGRETEEKHGKTEG